MWIHPKADEKTKQNTSSYDWLIFKLRFEPDVSANVDDVTHIQKNFVPTNKSLWINHNRKERSAQIWQKVIL